MVTPPQERLTLAAGIVILPLLLARHVIVGTSPGDSEPVTTLMRFYAAHRTGQMLSDYLAIVAGIAFLVFLTGLHHRLARPAEGGVLPSLVFAAGIAATAVLLLAFATDLVLAWKATAGDPPIFQTLWYLGLVLPEIADLPLAVCLAAAAAAILATGAFPRWLAWLGAATALCLIVATLLPFTSAVEAVDAVGFLLFLVWTLITGIVAVRQNASHSQERRMVGSPASLS